MRGHESIIQMRKQGKKPPFIFINDYPCKTDWFEHGEHATVCVHGDSLHSIDIPFVVGARVSISSPSEARAKTLFELAKEYGAKTVAACHVVANPFKEQSWCEVWHG